MDVYEPSRFAAQPAGSLEHPSIHAAPSSHPARPETHTAFVTEPVAVVVLALAVVAAGLLWRSGFISLPPDMSKYGGDALWALMVFVGFGFLFPRASTLTLAILALTSSWGVKFSQLYQAP